jgi:cytochrome c oxidase cbb3-type subunit 4
MKQFLSGVTGYENHLIFSMIIFIAFFIGLSIWIITLKKTYVDELKHLPFKDDKNKPATNNQRNN